MGTCNASGAPVATATVEPSGDYSFGEVPANNSYCIVFGPPVVEEILCDCLWTEPTEGCVCPK